MDEKKRVKTGAFVEIEKPDDNVVRVVRMSKFYGTLQALRQVSLEVDRGDIYGLIGPNGAGKTTLLKILATLIYPNYGSAFVLGHSVSTSSLAVRKRIGYMPDAFGYYEELTSEEYLRFYASIYKIPPERQDRLIPEVLKTTQLDRKTDTTVRSLSRGMQQRLQVARLLLHDPDVLLLDEPASGLDPRARIELKDLLVRLARAGKSIIISSHVLGDLQGFVNKLGVIERGRMLFSGPVDDLRMNLAEERRFEISLEGDGEGAADMLMNLGNVLEAETENGTLRFKMKRSGPGLSYYVDILHREGYKITRLEEKGLDLHEAFLLLTKGQVA